MIHTSGFVPECPDRKERFSSQPDSASSHTLTTVKQNPKVQLISLFSLNFQNINDKQDCSVVGHSKRLSEKTS